MRLPHVPASASSRGRLPRAVPAPRPRDVWLVLSSPLIRPLSVVPPPSRPLISVRPRGVLGAGCPPAQTAGPVRAGPSHQTLPAIRPPCSGAHTGPHEPRPSPAAEQLLVALHYSLRHESLGSGGELVLPASVCAGTMSVACLTGGAKAAGGSVSRGGGGAGVAPEAVSPAPRRDPSSAGTSPGPRANLRPRRHTPDFVPLLARHCRPSLPQAGAVRQAGPVEGRRAGNEMPRCLAD